MSFADLKAALLGGFSQNRSLLVNELGIICLTDPENGEEAEAILVSLLGVEDFSVRYAAYCFLIARPHIGSETQKGLCQFRDDPQNEGMLMGVPEAVRDLNIQLNSPPE